MRLEIVVLEDNADRRAAMLECLQDRFPQYEVRFFEAAADMVAYLRDHLAESLVISLDHDLELRGDIPGEMVDCGTGREVADYLASQVPVCPVLIHSTNDPCATGMEMSLREAGWTTKRVVPYGDLEWIRGLWFPTLRNLIVGSVKTSSKVDKRQRSA